MRPGRRGRRQHRAARAGLLPRTSSNWSARACSQESQLDELVAPMLLWKFQLGLFDDPYVDPDEAERVVGCDAHRDAGAAGRARDDHAAQERRRPAAARLRTTSRPSPSSARMRTAVCSAATAACRSTTSRCSTASRRELGKRVKVLYSEGCKITIGGSWNQDEVTAERSRGGPPADRRGGRRWRGRPTSSCWPSATTSRRRARPGRCKHMGDRTSLDLVGRQDELVRAMRRDRQAGGRAPVQWPAALDHQRRPRTCRRFSSAGISARKPVAPSPTCCSATSIRAASCPSPFRAPPATCRRSTTTSRRRGAATCSTTSRRCTRSASA